MDDAKPRGRSLITRMGIMILAVESLVLAAIGVFYYERFASLIDAATLNRLALPAMLMDRQVLRYDAVTNAEIMSRIVGPEFVDAMVVGGDGRVVYSLDQNLHGREVRHVVGLDLDWFRNEATMGQVYQLEEGNGSSLVQVTPLWDERRVRSYVLIKISRTSVQIQKQRLAGRFVLGSLLCIALTSVGILLSARRQMGLPLARLERQANDLAQGRLDRPITSESEDEIGRLAASLEEMRQAIVRQIDDLHSLNAAVGAKNVELEEAKHQLETSSHQYESLFDSSPDGILIVDASGKVLSCNMTLVRMFGLDRTACATGLHLADFFTHAPETGSELEQLMTERGQVEHFEAHLRDINGREMVVSLSAVPTQFGQRPARQIILRDVTGLKLAEERLRESEKKYRAIFENAVEGLFQTTPEGALISVNPSMARIFGYESVDEMLFLVSDIERQLYHDPKDRQRLMAIMNATGQVVGFEVRFRRKDGSTLWVAISCRSVCDELDRIAYLEGTVEDITIRKRAEEKLRQYQDSLQELVFQRTRELSERNEALKREVEERRRAEDLLRVSEARASALLDAIPDVMIQFNRQGVIEDFKGALGLGLSVDNYVGQRIDQIIPVPHAGTILDRVRQALDTGRLQIFEQRLSLTGLQRDYETRMVAVQDDSVLAIVRDITERKAAEAELAALNQNLEHLVEARTSELERQTAELQAANLRLMELDQMKSSFLSSVSHELRTPLTAILGFAKLINKNFVKDFAPLVPADSRQADRGRRIVQNLDIIIREGQRLTRMINEVLDLSRIEDGREQWRDSVLDLGDLMGRAAESLSPLLAAKPEIAFQVEMEPDLPMVVADADRIFQVLINLLTNAVKFTDQGAVLLRARRHAEGVLVSVEDQGMGIAPEDLERVFDKFYQGSQGYLLGKPEGTGLGLAISRQIVDHYGGRIWVESSVGEGARFHFILPITA